MSPITTEELSASAPRSRALDTYSRSGRTTGHARGGIRRKHDLMPAAIKSRQLVWELPASPPPSKI
jgi:hypothetical protein